MVLFYAKQVNYKSLYAFDLNSFQKSHSYFWNQYCFFIKVVII